MISTEAFIIKNYSIRYRFDNNSKKNVFLIEIIEKEINRLYILYIKVYGNVFANCKKYLKA